MVSGSMPRDGGNLILNLDDARELVSENPYATELLRGLVGSQELVSNRNRKCLWITDEYCEDANQIPEVRRRIEAVRNFRNESSAKTTRGYASIPHKFAQRAHIDGLCLSVAKTSSELREYLPADIFNQETVISDAAFAIYSPSIWELALVVSRLHLMWIATVCGKLETRYRYSSTLGWNTFPVPKLT